LSKNAKNCDHKIGPIGTKWSKKWSTKKTVPRSLIREESFILKYFVPRYLFCTQVFCCLFVLLCTQAFVLYPGILLSDPEGGS
jgi:hypothetical protein